MNCYRKLGWIFAPIILLLLVTTVFFIRQRQNRRPKIPLQPAHEFNLSAAQAICKNAFPSPPIANITPQNLSSRWQYIVVHHSGSIGGNAEIFERIHRERGMENGMAYHFVIGNGRGDGDGALTIGKRWREQLDGGHLRGDEINRVAIGICLVGDFTRYLPTSAQISTLKGLLRDLRNIVGDLPIIGHKDAPNQATLCPGDLPISDLEKSIRRR